MSSLGIQVQNLNRKVKNKIFLLHLKIHPLCILRQHTRVFQKGVAAPGPQSYGRLQGPRSWASMNWWASVSSRQRPTGYLPLCQPQFEDLKAFGNPVWNVCSVQESEVQKKKKKVCRCLALRKQAIRNTLGHPTSTLDKASLRRRRNTEHKEFSLKVLVDGKRWTRAWMMLWEVDPSNWVYRRFWKSLAHVVGQQ